MTMNIVGKNPFLMKRGTNSDDEQLLTERKQKLEGKEASNS